YLIVERRDERLLLRLGGEGGRTVHRTLLAQVPPADPRTRSTGKTGAAIGGVTAGPFAVYCPTGLGWFVAVDRETGRIRWASRYEGDHARPRRWGFDDDESDGEWMPVAPITGDGVVVFAPPDGEAVFGVARDSGRIAWLIARVNGLYVASAGPRTVAVVSPEEVAAYDVATGIPRWRTSLPPVGGVGTVAADGREFWLTLATGEVVSLATSDGSLTRGVVPAGGPAGRLTAVGGGRFVVHGGDDVALLTPTSRSASAADAAKLSVAERTARGARAVAAGDAAAAIAWVDIDDRPPADAKARAVLRAAYERLLAADPTDAAMRARFRELADGPSDATKADLFDIDAAVRSGQDRAVAEAALTRLLGSADPGRLVPGGETGLRVTLLTRLASLWTGLGRPGRPAEAVSAREDLDPADRLRVRRLFGTGRPDASAELVGSAPLIAQFDRRLSGEVGPAVVRPASFGVTGPREDDGRGVRVVRSGANGVETAVPLAICGESAPLAAAESWVFRRDVRRLVGRDRDGRTRASVPVGPPERSNGRLVAVPALYSAVAVGEALFAVTDGRMTACGRVDGRPLWSLPLPEGVFEPAGPEHIRGVASDPESLGVTPLVTAAALTSRDGPWGPGVAVGAGGVAVLDGTTLTLHDAVTGRVRWVREGLPASAALRVGDREVLVVAGDEAVFFNAEDGGRLSSPADGEVVAAIGPRWVMRDAPSGDGRSLSLRLVDVRGGGSGPTLRLPVDSSVGFVPGGLLVAVNRAGRVTLADIVTGDSDAVARVEGLGGPADDVAAFWSMGRLFVGVSGRRPSFLNVTAPAVHIDGVLACCDPREGGVVWTGKVSGRVPIGLPEHGFALPVIDGDIKRLDGTPYATLELTLLDPSAGTEIDRLSIARAVPAEVAAVVCRKDSVSFLSRAETLRVEPIARGLIPAPAVLRDADAADGGG
ncbi:MAG: PQQ-binding-like beta-propeller repeat protein, partial [Planctomycetota bacterium]